MEYSLVGRILPVYFRSNYRGEYRPIYGRMDAVLGQSPIDALHYHSCAEIGICLRGSGVTHVDDRIYTYCEGDMQYVPPGVPHLSNAAPDTESRWHWISLEPLRILEEAGFRDMTILQELSENSFAGVFQPKEYPAWQISFTGSGICCSGRNGMPRRNWSFLRGSCLWSAPGLAERMAKKAGAGLMEES